jgi:heptosyltransferase II
MKIGIIQPLPGIGDMIWHLPAIRAIAASAPDGRVTLFTKPSAQAGALFKTDRIIRDICPLPAARSAPLTNFRACWKILESAKLDQLYILHHSARYRWAAKMAGVPEILTYSAKLRKTKQNGWIKSLSFLDESLIPIPDRNSSLSVPSDQISAACQRYFPYPRPWFVVATGATEPSRQWPQDRFAAVIDGLLDRFGGTAFLIGTDREAGTISGIRAASQKAGSVVPVLGLPFDQVMALIAGATAIFGNDSGPVNVAAALQKPAFVLCATSLPALHSPHLHLIAPDLPTASGMKRISAQNALEFMASRLSESVFSGEKQANGYINSLTPARKSL